MSTRTGLFDANHSTFVRNGSLDELGWVDPASDGSKHLETFASITCCEHEHVFYPWSADEVVPVRRVHTWSLEDPYGRKVPQGHYFERVSEFVSVWSAPRAKV